MNLRSWCGRPVSSRLVLIPHYATRWRGGSSTTDSVLCGGHIHTIDHQQKHTNYSLTVFNRTSLLRRSQPMKNFCQLSNMSSSTNQRAEETGKMASDVFPSFSASRVLAISDLHVDYRSNLELVHSWTSEKYKSAALIVAGDVTDNLELLESTLTHLNHHFARVFYVPGNHEMWVRSKNDHPQGDSVTKYVDILELCNQLGVYTHPAKVLLDPAESDCFNSNDGKGIESSAVWIVPLHSWYAIPEEDQAESLYIKPTQWTDDPQASDKMWMDNRLCRWPDVLPDGHETISQYFASFNREFLSLHYDSPTVITFSHFLPRQDLIRPTVEDQTNVNKERALKGLGEMPPYQGGPRGFNFSRYAGACVIEKQLRQVGSVVHVFGHQHRNKDRVIEGVRYVQHCVGNPREQQQGLTVGLHYWNGPKQVWPPLESHGNQ